MILETERLTLTPLTLDDAPHVYPFMSDPEIMARWDRAAIEDPDEVAAFVAGQVEAMEAGKSLYWVIRLRESAEFLGSCELSDIDTARHQAELSMTMSQGQNGKGYGVETAAALMPHAFSLGFKRIVARVHFGDNRSEKLLLKLGFKQEGYLVGHVDDDGQRRDGRLFGLTL